MRIAINRSPLWKKALALTPFVYVIGLLALAAYCLLVLPVTLPLIFVGAIYHMWDLREGIFDRINDTVLWIYHPLIWVAEKIA
jgi:hypothetical protein